MARPPEHARDRCRAAIAFDDFIRETGLSVRAVAEKLGRTHPAVLSWCKGTAIPEPDNQVRIELFCAIPDPATGQPVRNPTTGHWVSHVPREWWRPEPDDAAPSVVPYALAAAGS